MATSGTDISTLFFSIWKNNEFWAAWIIPFILHTTSILIPGFFLEWAVRQEWSKPYHIRYYSNQPRWKDVGQPNIIPANQLYRQAVIKILAMGIVESTVLYSLHLDMFQEKENLPTLPRFLFEFAALYYTFDAAFYVGHYLFHKVDFFWNHFHSKHHQEHLPTAMSGGYTEWGEALIGAIAPLLVGLAVVQPRHSLSLYTVLPFHWIVFYPYTHSGMHIPWMDRFFLLQGILPFCATPRMHDAHHATSGRAATYLGATTWIWDWLAGTLIKEEEEEKEHKLGAPDDDLVVPLLKDSGPCPSSPMPHGHECTTMQIVNRRKPVTISSSNEEKSKWLPPKVVGRLAIREHQRATNFGEKEPHNCLRKEEAISTCEKE